jgi:YfiH family protein
MIFVDLPGGRVAFSGRRGGVSSGPFESLNLGLKTDDDSASVLENRQRLADAIGLDHKRIARVWQEHGTEIVSWGAPPTVNGFAETGDPIDHADGQTTTVPGLGLLIMVADCLPIALIGGGRVAMLHCGWRPLAGGMIEKALKLFDAPPAAAIGPGISQKHYEVGPEVLGQFADIPGVADGRLLSLRGVAAAKLRAGGVTHIEDVDRCTYAEADEFFSHRRDDGVTGRQAGIAWLT